PVWVGRDGSWAITGTPLGTTGRCRTSDGQYVLLFGSHQTVDFENHAVGEFLNVILRTALVIFRGFFVFDKAFDGLVGIATQIAHSDLGGFAFILDHLGQLLAALFGHGRHWHTDQIALT